MSINRRQFLRRSLAGSAAIVVGKEMNAANTPVSGSSFSQTEDLSPPAKGKSVLGLRCKPLSTVRIGVVGLGRGAGAVKRMAQIEGTEIVAICDLNPERIENSQKTLKNSNRKEAVAYTGEEDWKKIERKN